MGNQRLLLWALLGLVLWFNYQAWMKDYGPKATAAAPAVTGSATNAAPTEKPLSESVPGLPAATQPGSSAPAPAPAAAGNVPADAEAQAMADSPTDIRVITDVLDLDIGLIGGTLKRADLLMYPKHKNEPGVPVRLFDDKPGAAAFVFQSGLTAGVPGAQPDHLAAYTAAAREYRLADGQNELQIPLTWTNGQGITVTKTFTFKRGMYAVDVNYAVQNGSSQEWRVAPYTQFMRHQEHVDRSMWDVESYAFRGPAIYDGKKYKKLNIEKEEDSRFTASVENGWIAAMQHHFVAAVIPPKDKPYQFKLGVKGRDFLLSSVGPTQVIPAGGQQQIAEKVFVGPKLQGQLEKTGPELDRTADYGMLTIISKPLFQLLEWVHKLVGNWGWAIVIVTALIKLVFYPLSEASGRSMAKMRNLAPRIKNIQERYKDNREQLGRAMMDIYKREKINPLAGCLPMLIQIPVFLAFYWVLLESVEMRQAPFMLWINDLSSRDPFFILPVLMGGAMFAQFKLNPAPPDPIQAKVFMFMPIIMTVMFAWFPAGLVLYWFTNTLLSIAQQWNINRRLDAAAAAKKA